MSRRARQLIALTLIAALWTPAVILPDGVHASSTSDIYASQTSTASLLGPLWAKLAALTGSALQADEVAPAGMPPLAKPRRQPATTKPPLSKEERKAKVAGLKINPQSEVTLEAGQQMMLAAIPLDGEGNPVHGLGAEWESNRPAVVSVTADGMATAGELGKARLTASAGNRHETLSVTVVAAQPRPHGNVEQSALLRAHTPRTAGVRAALAAQNTYVDEDRRRYFSEVGNPPGQFEPGAATPPAAVGGTERPGTANFNFGVPILSLPGRGLDLSLGLSYNSRLWNKKKNGSLTTLSYDVDQSWPAPGFSLGYGKLIWANNSYVLIDGGGTRHPMKPSNGVDPEIATEYETTDGTYTKLTTNSGYKVVYTDGTQISYSGNGVTLYPFKMTDRQGNFINISYLGLGPRISTITDTLERTVTFNYEGNDLVSITAPPYADDGDDRPVIRFYYQNIVVNTSGSFSGVSVPSTSQNKSVRVISHVYFPGTGSGYAYRYSNPYGMINRIEQRREMTVSTVAVAQMGTVTSEGTTAASTEYDYPTTASGLSDVPKYTHRTDDWAGRTTPAPAYAFSVTEGASNLSTVTAPDGTVTETETFGTASTLAGLVKQITIKGADAAVLSKTALTWETDINDDNARLKQVLTTNEAHQTRGIVYTYDTGAPLNNNVTVVSERELTSDDSLSTVELRRTETTYEKGTAYLARRLLRLPTSVKVFEGGSSVASSFVEYKYDETALSSRPPLSTYTNPSSDQRGNVTRVIAYKNAAAPDINTANISQTVYDVTGNAVSMTLNCCQQKTIAYAEAFKFAYPTEETKGSAPDQLTTYSGYDFNTGLVTTSTDENSLATAFSYYPDNLRLDTIYRPDTSYTRYHYYDGLLAAPDASHLHSYVAVATASGVGTLVWSYQWMDGRGAVTRSFQNLTDANGWQTTDIEYDEMGRTKRTSSPYYSTGSGAPLPTIPQLWTSVEQYDGLGRATQVKLPDSTLVQTAYDGKTMTVTDQAGRQRRQVMDALGRVVRVDEPDAAGDLGTLSAPVQPTDYEYDALDNLTKVTQAGPGGITQQRTFKYDSLSHLTHERQVEALATLDDNGARLSSGGQWTGVYKYNRHGLITDAYDARGVHTTFEYDGLNRIHQVSYSGESAGVRTPAVTYTYDQSHPGYFNKGRLTEVRTDAVSTPNVQAVPQTIQAYDYDLMGRVVNQQQTVGTESYALSYAYNMLGQLTSETYPSGRVVSYEYDEGARLKKVLNGSAGNYATSFVYTAHGGLSAMTFGNGAVESISYNERLQPMQFKLTVAGVERQRFDYQYGVVNLSTGTVDATKNTGQIGRVEGSIEGVMQWQQRYQYDSLGRLDIATEHTGSSLEQLSWRADYDYDRWGNRYQSGGQNQNLAYVPIGAADINPQNNRLATGTTYDEAGNIALDQKYRSQQYRYDANGRQVWTAQIETSIEGRAVYDGLGQRVQSVERGATKTLVYDISGQLVAEYGGEVAGRGSTHYLMGDVQGSTRVLMKGSGAIEARHDYLPFGEEIPSDAALRTAARYYGGMDSTRQRYAGMQRDESGLDHTLWRKYESSAGRWTTADPYNGSMSIDDPQSFNRYAYVENDPVNRIDPSGLYYLIDGVSDGVGGFHYGPDGVYGGYLGDPNILIVRRWNFGEHVINNRENNYDWYASSFVSFVNWGFTSAAQQQQRQKKPEREQQQDYDDCVARRGTERDTDLAQAHDRYERNGLILGSGGAVIGGLGGSVIAPPLGTAVVASAGAGLGVLGARLSYNDTVSDIHKAYGRGIAECDRQFPKRPEIIEQENRNTRGAVRQIQQMLERGLYPFPRASGPRQ